MDHQTSAIITLLRSALTGERLALPDSFDWEQAVNTLCYHTLAGLGLQGALRCGIARTHPGAGRLMALFCKDVEQSRRQTRQLQALFALFEQHGISYLPVKGAILKTLYPQPELRPMGDADILIQQEQYGKIQALLPSLGFQPVEESDHEYIWKNAGLTLELHKRLVPSYNRDYYAYYGDGWSLARPSGTSSAYSLGPEDHFIFLLVHFAKDYRDGRPSVKNICDLQVFRTAYPNMDEAYLRSELKKLRLHVFYDHILALLACWFAGAPAAPAVELLTETTFRKSPFSQEDAAMAAAVLKNAKGSTSLSGGKRKWILDRVFPPAGVLGRRYPILRRMPVLLPIFWAIRWIHAAVQRSGNIQAGLELSKGLLQADPGQVLAYERQMNLVGLSFNREEQAGGEGRRHPSSKSI